MRLNTDSGPIAAAANFNKRTLLSSLMASLRLKLATLQTVDIFAHTSRTTPITTITHNAFWLHTKLTPVRPVIRWASRFHTTKAFDGRLFLTLCVEIEPSTRDEQLAFQINNFSSISFDLGYIKVALGDFFELFDGDHDFSGKHPIYPYSLD